MTVTIVPEQTPDQTELDLPRIQNPYNSIWWTNQSITGVPEQVMGWLVSQGWRIVTTNADITTVPPTTTYSLNRDVMNPLDTLLSLCNSYTIAANEARDANETRYREVVSDWKSMVSSTQTQFASQVSEQNTSAGVYLADLETYMDALDTLVSSNASELDSAVVTINSEVAQGQPEHDAYETQAEAILTLLLSDYTTHSAATRALLTTLRSTAEATLTLLASDHTTHDTTSAALLTGLGTTELARINAAFAATLSVQLQDLIDRGLSTSAVITDITARNTRDRDEEIAKLNDNLNRQKVVNGHTLYGQLVAMRNTTMATRDGLTRLDLDDEHKLYAEHVAVRATTLATRERLYSFVMELLKYRAAIAMQNATAIVEQRNRAIAAQMNIATMRLDGWKSVSADNQKLMAYQLDERNKLLVGLYSFVERRDDVGPSWADMNSLIAGLGDQGNSWLQP